MMGGAYEMFIANDGLDIRVAIAVDLLVECELHEAQYYNPGAFSFVDVEKKIQKELDTYNISDVRKKTIFDMIESLLEINQCEWMICKSYGLEHNYGTSR